MNRFLCTAATAWALCAAGAYACGGEYVVQSGETLSTIADTLYRDAGKWQRIHTDNLDVIGENPTGLVAGQTLMIACLDGLPILTGAGAAVQVENPAAAADLAAPSDGRAPSQPYVQTAAAPQQKTARQTPRTARETVTRSAGGFFPSFDPQPIRMLTGNDFRPFTDRTANGGGMLTEVVAAAMNASIGEGLHETYWLSDWQDHIDPVLGSHAMELAFPYAKPECAQGSAQTHCADYYYSDAMFEYLELLYVDRSKPLAFVQDSDLEGRTLCRPESYQTHILDEEGRNWIAEDKITLVQPELVSDCFFQLLAGEVDAVIMNEFSARETLALMGLNERIVPLAANPVAISSLHVMIHKQHPLADALLDKVNEGLQRIRTNGQHQSIVARYLAAVWAPN